MIASKLLSLPESYNISQKLAFIILYGKDYNLLKIPFYKILVMFLLCLVSLQAQAQSSRYKVKNRPFADQKLYHFGFTLGIHGQDLIMSHTGNVTPNGEAWFAEIPSYSPGFTVGIIGDLYVNKYMNLRLTPSLNFGFKDFVFREQTTGEEYRENIRNNYFTLPLSMKFSSERNNNIRPYVLAGTYAAMEIGSRKGTAVRLKKMDYGLEVGFGCNLYMPMFTLSPEIKFSFGLRDLVDKNRTDLTDESLMTYTDALASGKSRMVTLSFNFE